MHNNYKLTHLQLHAPEPLFSGVADYQDCLDVIAELARQTPVLAFVLLERRLHLLLGADVQSARTFMRALLNTLTGDAQHPLMEHCEFTALAQARLTQQVLALHALPCDEVASPDIHRWSSHHHYARNADHPWLTTAPFWRTVCPRNRGRARAYRSLLGGNSTSNRSTTETGGHTPPRKVSAQDRNCSGADVLARVLADHQCTPEQLPAARMRRRSAHLAGLAYAICQYLNVSDTASSALCATFALSEQTLGGYARAASRSCSQYIVQTANALGSHSRRAGDRAAVSPGQATEGLASAPQINLEGLLGLRGENTLAPH